MVLKSQTRARSPPDRARAKYTLYRGTAMSPNNCLNKLNQNIQRLHCSFCIILHIITSTSGALIIITDFVQKSTPKYPDTICTSIIPNCASVTSINPNRNVPTHKTLCSYSFWLRSILSLITKVL